MTKKIVQIFESYGLAHGFIREKVRIIVGLSGGSDSVALALLLRELREKYSIFLVCAHVNYHLRGADSDGDEQFVKEFCFRYNIPLYILSKKLSTGDSVQQDARDMRLKYFRKLKSLYKMDYIALAHHKDDQVETVLHRFLRGAGFSGLGGILPISSDIIHPLLSICKSEVLSYLGELGVGYCTDHTNMTPAYTRNKIRNDLIPHIASEYNPRFESKLVQYGQLFSMADEYFTLQGKKLLKRFTIHSRSTTRPQVVEIHIEAEPLLKISLILQFYVLREAWYRISGKYQDFYSVHFQDILDILAMGKGYKEIHLPDSTIVIKEYQYIIFKKMVSATHVTDGKNQETGSKSPSKILTQPRSAFSFNEHRFSMKKLRLLPVNQNPDIQDNIRASGYKDEQVVLDLDKISFPITLRYRLPGDKFVPLGMKNSKKLKDFFIDEKISLSDRDHVVIFADEKNIIWVAGYRIDERVAVTPETKNFLSIKIESPTRKKIKVDSVESSIKRAAPVETDEF
jgi:tRNA(Ile)-lysidine synthase